MIQHQDRIPGTEFYKEEPLPFKGRQEESQYKMSFCWKNKGSKGNVHTYQLRPGLLLNVAELSMKKTIDLSYEVSSACVNFSCCLFGSAHCRPDIGQGSRQEYSYTPASTHIHLIPEHQGAGILPAGSQIVMVELYVTIDLFANFLSRQDHLVSPFTKRLDKWLGKEYLVQPVVFSKEIQHLNQQIIQCPFHGPLERLYLEGKSLEIIALYMDGIKRLKKNLSGGHLPMRPHEEERVRYAGELVKKHMQSPLTLMDLAQAVGISHSKLNRFFPQIYGSTVFDYLRDLRMRHAKMLLEQGDVNVTEAAISVGYSNLSHFSKAFRKKFGQLPSNYLREILINRSSR